MGPFIIYALHHEDSQRIYVGQSIRGLERARHHGRPYQLKHGRTPATLASWIKKYQTRGGYQITVLEECAAKDDLNEAEKFHIGYLRSLGLPLLNRTDGGDGNPGRHIVLTPAARERIRVAMKAFVATPEGRVHMAKMTAAAHTPSVKAKRSAALTKRNTGAVISDAAKQKLRVANLGKKQSAETVAKRAASNRGKRRSAEFCERMRVQGSIVSEETRAVRRARMLGNKMSPESIAKMIATKKARQRLAGVR